MEQAQNIKSEVNEVNLRDQIAVYLRHWPWFVISVLVFVTLSFIYLRYATPIYQTRATILIKDEKNSALSELAAFQDLGLTGTLSPSGFENEIQILKSKNLTELVVRELKLNIEYFVRGNVRDAELFSEVPFTLHTLTPEDSLIFPAEPIYIKLIDSNRFNLRLEDHDIQQEFSFGQIITLPVGEVMISANPEIHRFLSQEDQKEFRINISPIPWTVAAYQQNIQIDRLMDMSSVIQMTLNHSNSGKARAILDELIMQYNKDAREDRNMVSQNTANFINGRLQIISEELDSVETGKVEFKEQNRLTDLRMEGEIFLRSESEFNRRATEIDVQLELIADMINYVNNSNENDLLPMNIGIESDRTASSVQIYNQVVLDRLKLLNSSTEKNPAVVVLADQLRGLKQNVIEALHTAQKNLQIKKADLLREGASIDSKIGSAPSKEKIFRSINRQQEIKETLYLYLLQKREENAITMAVTTPKAKVVDYAYSSLLPVAPKKNIIRLAALIVGLLIPFGVIYLRELLDNKIRDKSDVLDVEKETPIIGEIPKLDKKDAELVQANDRSVLAESFRILRTNLQYFTIDQNEDSRGTKIFVTSTIKGEGKTFCSFNLALTLANSGSKVALVGADVRNPQLQRYDTSGNHRSGVVEYLVNQNSSVQDYLVQSSLNKNLTLLFSGTIPPNPAELWMRDRAASLFEELSKSFDYIVVDTAPTLLVTDTFLISKYADITLYVVRAGHTEKRLLEFPSANIKSGKLKNVAFVLNNISMDKIGYGNRYGYYYVSQKSKWERFKERIFG